MDPTRRSVLEGFDPEKRATLRKLAAGAAFVGPVVLSFSIGGLSIGDARAYVSASGDRSDVRPFPSRPDEAASPSQPPTAKPRNFGEN